MEKNLNDNFKLAMFIKEKIDSDITCDARKQFLLKFEPAERVIIEKSCNSKGRFIDLWSVHAGVVK